MSSVQRKRTSSTSHQQSPAPEQASDDKKVSGIAKRALEQAKKTKPPEQLSRLIETNPGDSPGTKKARQQLELKEKIPGNTNRPEKRKPVDGLYEEFLSEKDAATSPPSRPKSPVPFPVLKRQAKNRGQEAPPSAPTHTPVVHLPIQPLPIGLPAPLPMIEALVTEVDRRYFHENVKSIVAFPGDDKDAQIKSVEGKLTLVWWTLKSSWLSSEYYYENKKRVEVYLKGGTQFDGTCQVFFRAFSIATNNFCSKDLELSNAVVEKKRLVQELAEALQIEINLFVGFQQIKHTYTLRYIFEPDHRGLPDFSTWIEDIKERIDAHFDRYMHWAKEFEGSADVPVFQKTQPRVNANVKRACSNLPIYCQTYNPQVSLENVQNKILLGRELFRALLTRRSLVTADHSNIANLCWLLMYYAIKTGAGHHEGSFVIENANKLFFFLKSASDVGDRSSSHCIGRSPVYTGWSSLFMTSSSHLGIDIPDQDLPALKRTIVFQMIDFAENSHQKVLFFKMENYGTFLTTDYGLDYAKHGLELAASINTKCWGYGGDDLVGMRKERVPVASGHRFDSLIKHLLSTHSDEMNSITLEIAKEKAKLWGIAYMHKVSEKFKDYSDETRNLTAALIDSFGVTDHLDRRTGKEVYLSLEDLEQFVKEEQNFVF